MRRLFFVVAGVIAVLCAGAWGEATGTTMDASPIRLGNAMVALGGPWKFTPGDSEWNAQTQSFAWADPGFDDARWGTMDLRPNGQSIDVAYGFKDYVPGWTARGYPRLFGYAWYRLRIHVDAASGPVWIKMPDHVDDSYQLYANGSYVGELGDFLPGGVACYRSRPLFFKLPPPDARGEIELAVRFYMEPSISVIGNSGEPGGMHQAPSLLSNSLVGLVEEHSSDIRIRAYVLMCVVWFALLVGVAGAFWIYLLDRPRKTFLWLTLSLLCFSVSFPATVTTMFTFILRQGILSGIQSTLGALSLLCWIFFWRDWFDLPRSRRIERTAAAAAAVVIVGTIVIYSEPAEYLTLHAADWIRLAAQIVLGTLLFVQLFEGARRDRTAALLAVTPILLLVYTQVSPGIREQLGMPNTFFPFGIQINSLDIAEVLLLLVVGALALRRFIRSQVSQKLERQGIELEMEQARQLQQRVLVPERIDSPHFTVESVYYPAKSVGGDFFQVMSHADGSLLIVVGDVSGKGMAAAMLVAVLVGAIRTRADETFDPAAMLRTLNERLLGRAGNHFATCMAAHLKPNGELRVANAGHLPLYRNGVPLESPGELPLGIVGDARYETPMVRVDAADTLTFVTDGVLEARNGAGHLLGFERLAQLSTERPEAIAQAAIDYGQDDDITVVQVLVVGTERGTDRSLDVAQAVAGTR